MRNKFFIGVLFSVILLAVGFEPQRALADEVPSISVRTTGPGSITVNWSHSGVDVDYFNVQREDPPYSDSTILTRYTTPAPVGQMNDLGLKASTPYKYRVCAVSGNTPTCSGWASATTLNAPPHTGGTSGGTQTQQQPTYQLRTPTLTATPHGAVAIDLNWAQGGDFSIDSHTLGDVQLFRDRQVTYDTKEYGSNVANFRYTDQGPMYHAATRQWTGQNLRPNTGYYYQVCFIGMGEASGQTKCSNSLTAMGTPVVPTAPANVTFSKRQIARGKSRSPLGAASVALSTVIFVNWRAPDLRKNEIPGQFITVEREDRVVTGGKGVRSQMFSNAWVEINRITAKGDPTAATVDLTSPARSPSAMDTPGNNYRLCALVPALGAAGKVCSPPTTVP